MRPALIASITCSFNSSARPAASQTSPPSRASAMASLFDASCSAVARSIAGPGGGAASPPPPPPQPARASRKRSPSLLGRSLVGVLLAREHDGPLDGLLEVPLLDRLRPIDELLHVTVARIFVQLLDDCPVADLAGLRHRQKLETVERVGLFVEVRVHHLGRLLLRLASLLLDRGLLPLEPAGDLGPALCGLRGLLRHLVERLDEILLLLLARERLDL